MNWFIKPVVGIAVLVTGISLGIVVHSLLINVLSDAQSTLKKETLKIHGEWCYLKTIQPGEAIQENNAGVYEYQIYATQKGIEVWGPCQPTR